LVITALVVLCCSTLTADSSQNAVVAASSEANVSAPAEPGPVNAGPALPDAPLPKVDVSKTTDDAAVRGSESSSALILPLVSSPVKPATPDSYETPRKRKIWYGLVAAGHSAAVFDAWTTRRAISGGYGVEGDPLQRPFANSGAIYASTQVCPLLMDLLGRRMMRSNHAWMRKSWWVPQAAGATVSLGAGIHNYRLVP
jgi:hypothetical protein